MESIKWKLVLAELSPITILKSYKSVLVGQAFAFFTPARSGDYVGRILFLEAGSKLKGLAQMAWASYAQLLITLFFGLSTTSVDFSFTTSNQSQLLGLGFAFSILCLNNSSAKYSISILAFILKNLRIRFKR